MADDDKQKAEPEGSEKEGRSSRTSLKNLGREIEEERPTFRMVDGQMVMEFYPDAQYGNNDTNYWAPTLHCLGQMVRSAGFAHVDGAKLVENPDGPPYCRGFVTGRRQPAPENLEQTPS